MVVGAGAKILGGFTVGDGARIGSNAVVVKEVPAGATVVGVPGRLVEEITQPAARFAAYAVVQEQDDPYAKAIEGPMLAERFTGLASANVWDAGKLEAMEGRQLAEQFRSEAGSAVVWDAGKLEAMEGRQLAEEVRHRPHGGPLG